MDTQVLFMRQGNDEIVEARFGPEVTDPTGVTAWLYIKDNRYTSDAEAISNSSSGLYPDPDNPTQYMSSWIIPGEDTSIAGSFWYRVDLHDALDNHRTAGCGTLLVEAV